jgi:8-amino-7-oxononanoate synthase
MPDRFERVLQALRASGRLRTPRETERTGNGRARVDGRDALVLCSNDYLGLADLERLAEAAAQGARRYGVGAGASRLISGTLPIHAELEQRLAAFVGAEAALLFPSGYQANVGALPAIAGEGDVVYSDALNHASLIDGCRLSRAAVEVFPHRDPDALERLLARRSTRARAWIVTESLFSMDGDEAPLTRLRDLARRYDAELLVDEAHALGVLGPQGRGLCAEAAVRPDLLIGTLGKAFGCAGAFAAGSRAAIDCLANRARSYVYTTGIAVPVAAAALAAVSVVEAADDRRARVLELASRARAGLARRGVAVAPGRSPILPIVLGDDGSTMRVCEALLEAGFFIQGIRPPTVPEGTSRLRMTLTAALPPADVDSACSAIAELISVCQTP